MLLLLCHFVSHNQLNSVLTPCLRITGVPSLVPNFAERTYARTRFGLNSDLSCFSAPLAWLIRCHKKRCILWPFLLMLEFVFTCKYHCVTGESCIYMVLHTCWVIVWIKCRQSGKCPVFSCVGALACWESKSTYHFYCRITYIASQMQSDLDFCN